MGVTMIVEWTYHGRYHPGYDWIVCYAPVMIALPVLSWMICLSFAFAFNKGQVKLLLPVTDQSQLEQPQDEVMQQLPLALHYQQPGVVQVQPVHDHTSDSNLRRKGINIECLTVETDNKDDTETLKRSCSLPVYSTPIDNSKIKRTSSF
ncbi:unnamed protein product [Ilex paraguariensis]|uniref:Uncharacterized protein n=1 Tax=Ilex paraguariensis TaxID=185542 RepID=A0ABC8RAT1_9AQUA